jgi:hypothetical protein
MLSTKTSRKFQNIDCINRNYHNLTHTHFLRPHSLPSAHPPRYSLEPQIFDTSDQLSPPQTAVSSYDLIGLDTVRFATECLRVATVCCCAVPFMALCEISTQPSTSSFEQRV